MVEPIHEELVSGIFVHAREAALITISFIEILVCDCLFSPSAKYEDIELSNIRKVIAERLVLSKTTIPHFYVNVECNMDKVIK